MRVTSRLSINRAAGTLDVFVSRTYHQTWTSMMSKLKNCNVTIWLVVFATCPTMGQSPTKTEARPRVQQGAYAVDRPVEASELAKDNNARVAASAVQIKDVLVKDAGIMVELKRWIAKEATDNGQIVEDVSLTDQAIFD